MKIKIIVIDGVVEIVQTDAPENIEIDVDVVYDGWENYQKLKAEDGMRTVY